jgi:membrane associated rhomboid family serine protease
MSVKYVNPEEEKEHALEGSNQNAIRATPVVPYFTYALVGSLVLVYLVQFATNIQHSVQLADSDHLLIRRGEYWRIITGATMHSPDTIAHVFLNCMALFNLGNAIEYLSNKAHLAIVFLFAVVGGGILSVFLLPDTNSVGASGGIVGLLGYLAVYGYKRRRLLPPSFLRTMLINIGIMVLIGVVGYQYIDNGAHLGGFIVGSLYGFVQIPNDLRTDPREADTVTSILGYACLAAFLGFAILTILLLTQKIHL